MNRLFFFFIFFLPLHTLACSRDPGWFQPSFDKDFFDAEVPPMFSFSVQDTTRGQGATVSEKDNIFVSSSCDDLGSIQIKIESNDGMDPCNYGFYIYDKNKSAPEGLIPRNPIQPKRINEACVLTLRWIDGATWSQEIIKLQLEFEAVDNFLFKSDRSEVLEYTHDGN